MNGDSFRNQEDNYHVCIYYEEFTEIEPELFITALVWFACVWISSGSAYFLIRQNSIVIRGLLGYPDGPFVFGELS